MCFWKIRYHEDCRAQINFWRLYWEKFLSKFTHHIILLSPRCQPWCWAGGSENWNFSWYRLLEIAFPKVLFSFYLFSITIPIIQNNTNNIIYFGVKASCLNMHERNSNIWLELQIKIYKKFQQKLSGFILEQALIRTLCVSNIWTHSSFKK